jgi:hypothetical protein
MSVISLRAKIKLVGFELWLNIVICEHIYGFMTYHLIESPGVKVGMFIIKYVSKSRRPQLNLSISKDQIRF